MKSKFLAKENKAIKYNELIIPILNYTYRWNTRATEVENPPSRSNCYLYSYRTWPASLFISEHASISLCSPSCNHYVIVNILTATFTPYVTPPLPINPQHPNSITVSSRDCLLTRALFTKQLMSFSIIR